MRSLQRRILRKAGSRFRNGLVFLPALLGCFIGTSSLLASELAPGEQWNKKRGGGWTHLLGVVKERTSDGSNDSYLDESIAGLESACGCIIDTVIVEGNKHTKPSTITREMISRPGSRLDEKSIRRDVSYLRGLGYFASVTVAAEPTETGRCRLLIRIIERPKLFMLYPYPVVNYDFEKGLSYGFSWKVKNFRGNAEDLALTALRRQDEEQGAGFSWRSPWFAGKRIQVSMDLSAYERLKEPTDPSEEYIDESKVSSMSLGFPLTKSLARQTWLKPRIGFEARSSRRSVEGELGSSSNVMYRQDFVQIGGEFEYDSRSDRISPFSGTLLRFSARRYTCVAGPKEHYILYGTRSYLYFPIAEESAFIISLRGEIKEGDIASFYEMRLGGVRDVRGYSDETQRGRVKLIGTIQYRSRFIGPRVIKIPWVGDFDFAFNWTAFVDSGTLANEVLDLDTSDYHTTAGMGIEIISPFRDLLRIEAASDGTGQPTFFVTAGSDF